MILTLVRHAATALNAAVRYQGHIDPPLSPAGEAAARALAKRLREPPVGPWSAGRPPAPMGDGRFATWAADGRPADREPAATLVYSSDLVRARRTAALAFPGAEVRPDPRLRELHFGAFDGRTYAENVARFGRRFHAWLEDPARVRPPGGELLGELEARVLDWLADLPRAGRVIAVTHAGPIRVLLAHLARVPFDDARRTPIAPCDVIRLRVPDPGAASPTAPAGPQAVLRARNGRSDRDGRFSPDGRAPDAPPVRTNPEPRSHS